MVNLQDMIGLKRINSSDVLDLEQAEPCMTKSHKGKMVKLNLRF